MKNKNNKEMKMTKKIFLSLTLLFCYKAYVNAMELKDQKIIKPPGLLEALATDKNIEPLIENGADPSEKITIKNLYIKEEGRYLLFDRTIETTPLNFALYCINIKQSSVALLIKNTANVGIPFNCTAYYAKTGSLLTGTAIHIRKDPIHVLISGQKSVEEKILFINLMQKYGFNICSTKAHHIDYEKGQGHKDNYCKNESALHILCNIDYPDENNWKIANVLIKNGVDANHKDSNGDTPAHILAKKFLWLITNPKSHSIKDVTVYTSDEYKTIFKNIVDELLKGGANLDLENNKKQTPAKISENLNFFFKLFSVNYNLL